jgi:hypothetical protein
MTPRRLRSPLVPLCIVYRITTGSYFRRAQACRATPGGHQGRQWGHRNIAAQVPATIGSSAPVWPPAAPALGREFRKAVKKGVMPWRGRDGENRTQLSWVGVGVPAL